MSTQSEKTHGYEVREGGDELRTDEQMVEFEHVDDLLASEDALEDQPTVVYAGWWRRFAGFVLDAILPVSIILVFALGTEVLDRPPWLVVLAVAASVVVAALAVANVVYLQGATGFTLGKSAVDARTQSEDTGRPVGSLRAFVRMVLHLVDTAPLFAGWFNPLRDAKSRTFADKLSGCVVVRASLSTRGAGVGNAPDRRRRTRWGVAVLVFVWVALLAGLVIAQQFSQNAQDRVLEDNSVQSVTAASDAAEALLTYSPDDVETALVDARSALTGNFLDYYTQYTDAIVIPTAKEQGVTTAANVGAAAVVTVSDTTASVLLFLDQSTSSTAQPTASATASSVLVDLVKIDGRFMISEFKPM